LIQPLDLEKEFDLVVSLEVAEHLPASAADQFVNTLVKHGKKILFSAAIPGQGGQDHLNEQWPDYW
jgi:2-polyprenyl-3-methyl-5-hydroxy-6-metoxy-1,4-benzoquinol methylase